MTAIADPPAATGVATDAASVPATHPSPVATLAADLMPDEIVVQRRLAYLKRRLVFVMAALVALVVLGDMLVRQQTSRAENDLSAANNHITTLNGQLNHFNAMLSTQSDTQAIWTQLDGVMGTDVSWPALLTALSRPAPAGLHLTSITAQVDGPGDGTSATTDPSSTVPDAVGSLTLTGNTRTWSDVATYVRGLSALKGFTAVNPSTVSNGVGGPGNSGGGQLTFTVTLDLTEAALSNRYLATPSPGTGGTTTTGTGGTTQASIQTSGSANTHPSVSTSQKGHQQNRTTHSSGGHVRHRNKHTTNGAGGANGLNQKTQEAS